ncbi:MAG: O-antigen ligase family protein [Chloroflexota bacterium]|nr:O-antigen ligase family protein [Chloroflexota bacterium]
MSLRFLVTVAAMGLSLPLVLRLRDSANRKLLRRVLLPSVALVIVATVVDSTFSDSDYVIKYFRYQTVQVLVLLVAAAVISSRRDLKRVALVALAVGLVAAVACVWQHYGAQSAIYGNTQPSAIKDWKGRSVGLSDSPVTVGNQLTFVLMPLLGVLAAGPMRRDRARMMLCAAVLVVFAGLNFTYTRSAVFAIGPGLVLMGLYLRGRRRVVVLGMVVGLFVMFQMLEGTGLIGSRYYKDASEDRSASSHEALWDVGLAVALDNAIMGIGHEHFEEVSLEYLHVLDEELIAMGGAGSIGQERPHNDWLSVWTSWGILALVAYIGIFVGALRNLAVAAGNSDTLVRGLAVGCAGGLATYALNSAYHNYMDSSTTLWLYAGASVALARLPSHEETIVQLRNRVYPRGARAVPRASARLYRDGYV